MSQKKDPQNELPLVVYVDDEPRNITLVEVSLPDDQWQVRCFDSAIEALQVVQKLQPAVIVSDQRMPHMSGLEFLEVCSQLAPDAVRMIVTGQTDEAVIVELVRRAKIFDYITKPWQANDFCARVQKAVDLNRAVVERKRAFDALQEKNRELEERSNQLLSSTAELREVQLREVLLRQEMEGWIPWPITKGLKEGSLSFPFRKDIVCLVFDIVDSSRLANVVIEGHAARGRVMKMFRELVMSHGGMTESQGGDACYAHFGAFDGPQNPAQAALNAAREFRVRLRSFSKTFGIDVECGIAIHFVEEALVDQDTIRAPFGKDSWRVEKSVLTQSKQIDLVHRMEKLTHNLRGTNIILSEQVLKKVDPSGLKIVDLGSALLRGQDDSVGLHLLMSDLVSEESLEKFRKVLSGESSSDVDRVA